MQLASAAQMRELDRQTIEEIGIPGMVLMENAGRGTVDLMESHYGSVQGKTVCIFTGPGNNGGDGLVIARTVHGKGGFPFLFFLVAPEQLKGDAGLNFAIVQRLRLPYQVLDYSEKMATLMDTVLTLNRMQPIHSIVDAIFGIGLTREVEGHFGDVIHCMNLLRERHHMPLIAVDIPSGLNSDTGVVHGCAIQADHTVTYGQPKPGHYHHGGTIAGTVHRVDIGIPLKIVERAQLKGLLLDQSLAVRLSPRETTAHKGTNGHLLVVAGSEGKTGAALLSAQGALRSGAGLVSLAVPAPLNPIFETALAEAMTIALPSSRTYLSIEDQEPLQQLATSRDCLIIGPGMGLETSTGELVAQLYQQVQHPMVVDADAITHLATRPDVLRKPAGPRIFTPHPGEMARLIDQPIASIQTDRLQAAQWLQEIDLSFPMITVLKGAGTVVADTTGRWAVNTSGNPGMGAGGMGDVLAGIIGGLLAQGYPPWEAACLGVYLHGLAADRIAHTKPYGYTASEVACELPLVLGELLQSTQQEDLC